MSPSNATLISILSSAVIGSLAAYHLFLHRRRQYPPGPTPFPLLGNIGDIDPKQPWISYTELGNQLNSPIVHTSILGQHTVVINSYYKAREILSGGRHNHVSGPLMWMLDNVAGAFGSKSPSSHPLWKPCRKEAEVLLRPSGAKEFRALEMRYVGDIIAKLKESPEKFREHCRYFTSMLNLEIAYGSNIRGLEDNLVDYAAKALESAKEATMARAVVDIFPWVCYLPSWIPGMGWKADSMQWRRENSKIIDIPFDLAMKSPSTRGRMSSLAKELLQRRKDGDAIDEDVIRLLTTTIVFGAVDTQTSVILSFFLCMTLFPDVQAKAQQQIDNVVGHDRLPVFEDHIPRMASEDDLWEHNGNHYFIPKGTIIVGNVWAMTRDPQVYPNPDIFDPTRFLDSQGTMDPNVVLPDMIYGFRPKACPVCLLSFDDVVETDDTHLKGKWMAEDIIFIFIANVLAQLRISPKDPGNVTTKRSLTGTQFDQMWEPGILRYPKEFECNIIPRRRQESF
ncbi:cytochrome P450 [Flagelloscypha sp. PMI_526]|nr:cytochrome P450 [Flagelloscypha sp. PMI_526]